ncbi:MAG: sodium:proton antiporter [Saprospiraceae bacterium]|nr:cation:proton antiporter [Bacteroidia bacterium]NNF22503.1 sodium:proton antiporter [Saprospiraceae bacterium]NNK89491.1 sodium:proton antiporter [Saprospiraceae bacterium]
MIELGSVIILGIFAQWVAWRIKVPAILPLILIGLAVGPLSTYITGDEQKLLEPIWNNNKGLFPGDHLFHFVELAIGIILFEGGLSLKREEVKEVGPSIIKIITLGSLITFIGGAGLAHFIMNLTWPISFLFSGLIIVTGPTVISPILRNLPLKRNISALLKWEGILIDPIGALVAVLVFEFIKLTHAGEGSFAFTGEALKQFILIALVGSALGFFSAHALKQLLKRDWIPHYLLTVFTLAYVLAVFILSGILVHDSGLLTVVILGMVIGNIEMPHKNDIIYFGESISILLIAVLFILLAANINISDLQLLLDWRVGILFLSVILLLRPLGVFLSTSRSSLTTKEKMFISWVGPRGIVAAGIASLFGLKLFNMGIPGAEYITPLVFMIVLGTVILNATTAGLVAKWLGVLLAKSNGILMVGAHRAARIIANYMKSQGQHVVLVDSNSNNIDQSEEMGLDAFIANIYNDDIKNNADLNDVGYIMALTGSADVNDHAIKHFEKDYGENGAYRLVSISELQDPENIIEEECLFSRSDDFIHLLEVSRDYPDINELEITSNDHFKDVLEKITTEIKSIPILLKKKETNEIQLILANSLAGMEAEEGDTLVYLGKPLVTVEANV